MFQLRVTCRRGQATSMPRAGGGGGGGGGWRFVKYEVFCVFFFSSSLSFFIEGYIIYRIVNCVSVI